MEAILVEGVGYRYPDAKGYALRGLDFHAGHGEYVLVEGPSGSGKSTLCRLLNGLIPHFWGGTMTGRVLVEGLDTRNHSVAELARRVGLLFQDPETQMIAATAEAEIAFGLENMRLREDDIRERITWAAGRLGAGHLLGRRTAELSAGEKQKVVLASVLAMKPGILVLDEPSSQLDLDSRRRLYEVVDSLNGDGMTVILVEHNEDAERHADRVYELGGRLPLAPAGTPRRDFGETLLEVDGLAGGYGGIRVFSSVSFQLRRGECLAIMGPNGSGKTTLLRHLNGLMKPMAGQVRVMGLDTRRNPTERLAKHISYLPQNPQDMLFCDTAEEELRFTLKHLGKSGDVAGTLEGFGLYGMRGSYPRDLSVGERQRLALSAVLVARPDIVVLDEPTRGMDQEAKAKLTETIRRLTGQDKAVVLATHDERLAGEVAASRLTLGGGR